MIKLVKRFFIFFITIFIIIIFIKKDYFSNKLKYLILSFSNSAEMVLNEVYITGRKHEKKDDIIEALNIDIGDPVFSFDLEALRKRINNLAWVNYSKVYLRPLGQLDIVLSEYLAFGVFKFNEEYYLINNEGIKFKIIQSFEFPDLFRLYGEGAIISIKDLSPIVKKLEQLNLEVIKIERVDSRRWNIYIKQGYFIKLPNFNPINAIDYLYQLNNNINYTNLYSIDLRIENRISLKYNQN